MKLFCWHKWKPSKFQFQALTGPQSLTLKCVKCGKIKVTT